MKKMVSGKKALQVFVVAVIVGSIGAGIVTIASLSPYTEKTFAFAMFCWFIVVSGLVGTIHFAKTVSYSNKSVDEQDRDKKTPPTD